MISWRVWHYESSLLFTRTQTLDIIMRDTAAAAFDFDDRDEIDDVTGLDPDDDAGHDDADYQDQPPKRVVEETHCDACLSIDPDGAPSSTPDMTAPRQQLHQQAGAHAPLDTLHSWHDVSAHVPATVEADSLAAFVALGRSIQNGPAAEHSSDQPAAPGPACGAHDDTLPKRALIPFTHNDSGLPECETHVALRADSELQSATETLIAQTQRPSAARKLRSVVRREDILEELHVAVRLREAPLPRGQKLQSSWD